MIYIAGPMSGYPGMNFDNFNRVAAFLRSKGETVVNPAEINPDLDADWSDCMDADIDALFDCVAIYMLTGWEKSKGARIEHRIAVNRGIDIEYETV